MWALMVETWARLAAGLVCWLLGCFMARQRGAAARPGRHGWSRFSWHRAVAGWVCCVSRRASLSPHSPATLREVKG